MAKEAIKPSITLEEAPDTVIDTLDDYRRALDNAQLDGLDYIEVSEKVFNRVKPGHSDIDNFTTGNPGVMVYKLGKREALEAIERMSASDYHEYITKLKSVRDH